MSRPCAAPKNPDPLDDGPEGGGEGGGYGGLGGGDGAGGGGAAGIIVSIGTHALPSPFPFDPPSHMFGCTITVTLVPFGYVTSRDCAGEHGIPGNAPYVRPLLVDFRE